MLNCTGPVKRFGSFWGISGIKLFLFASFFLLILSACSPSQAAAPEGIPSLASSPLPPADTPTNQINIPTLVPTKTLVPPATHTPTATATQTPVPEYRNSIVFVSDRDGNKEIYRMDADGSDFARLTDNIGDDSSPRWSHDKTRISFLSSSGVSDHLYTIKPDGSDMLNLTPGTTGVSQCEWSPVAYLIACISVKGGSANNGLIIVDPDQRKFKTAFTAQGDLLDLAWSPDGEQIALAAAEVDGLLVYNLAEDSLAEHELGSGLAQRVAWSHTGNRLAYSFGPRDPDQFATMYTVKIDFLDPKRWLERGGPDWVQSFSPGDEYVLLESSRLGHSEIFVVDLAGRQLIQLTNTEEGDGNSSSANAFPVYSADGERIVYVSIRAGQSDIFLMDADGTRARNLSDHPAVDTEPDW
jgi:Tol biopolymer transport system component